MTSILRLPVLLCICFCLSFQASAEELCSEQRSNPDSDCTLEMIVSANRLEVPRDEVVASCSVVQAEEIERRQQRDLAAILSALPSADVVQSGGPGGSVALGLRGAGNEHSLVLIDGIEANNPITPAGTYNFSGLVSDNIDRIEVLRGPQSVLYGSSALGGVVNIISKRGESAPEASALLEAGSFGTWREQAESSGAGNDYHYSLGLWHEDTDGISAASSNLGNTEKDGHSNTSFSTRLGSEITSGLGAELILRYIDARTELDNTGGVGGDDPNRLAEDQQMFGRAEVTAELSDSWKQIYGISFADQYYEDNNDPDASHPLDLARSHYEGGLTKADLQNQIKLGADAGLVLGLESKEEIASSKYHSESAWGPFDTDFDERSSTTNAYYAQGKLKAFDALYADAGMRYSDHSRFGGKSVWQGGLAWMLRETGSRLSTNIGTGFRAPSLFQLYSSYGDENLQPEKSLGLDAGIEQRFMSGRLVLGETYFHNRFRDLITFDPGSFLYANTSRAVTQGLETTASFELSADLKLEGNYTWLDAENSETHEELLRRARHRAALWLDWSATEDISLSAGLKFAGLRYDTDYSSYPAARVNLASYATLNLGASYRLSPACSLFVRGENLLDREYEEVSGFGVAGAAVYAGVKFTGGI